MKLLILDNIRSVLNVGAMFRTAEAIGVDHMYLVGITPTPLDRFGRERSDFAKAAVGAQTMVDWSYYKEQSQVLDNLQHNALDIPLYALEKNYESVHYKNILPTNHFALVVGSETSGVSQDFLVAANKILHIPMYGQKESLNVSTACGIALYGISDT